MQVSYYQGFQPQAANVLYSHTGLGGVAVSLTIPGPFSTDILPIMAVAVESSSKSTTEMEGGTGE